MSFPIATAEHAIASIAHEIVKEARVIIQSVLPALRKAQAEEKVIESVTALIAPNAVAIERAAFAVLGKILAVIDAAHPDTGVTIPLDPQEITDLKALAVQLKPAS